MYNYEIMIRNGEPSCIIRTNDSNIVTAIPFDEGNVDYQQYLIDTDGGLPLPKETI